MSIEAAGAGTGIADLVDHAPHQGVEVNPGGGCYFTCDQAKAGVDHGLAGNSRSRVLGQQGVEHRIAHLVTDLVGVPFCYRLGGEDVAAHAALIQLNTAYVLACIYLELAPMLQAGEAGI